MMSRKISPGASQNCVMKLWLARPSTPADSITCYLHFLNGRIITVLICVYDCVWCIMNGYSCFISALYSCRVLCCLLGAPLTFLQHFGNHLFGFSDEFSLLVQADTVAPRVQQTDIQASKTAIGDAITVFGRLPLWLSLRSPSCQTCCLGGCSCTAESGSLGSDDACLF